MDVVGGLCLLACSWWVCEPRRTVKWLQNEECRLMEQKALRVSVRWWDCNSLRIHVSKWFLFCFFGKHQMAVAIVWEWICWSRWLFRSLELDRAVADSDIVSCTARGYSNYRFVKVRLCDLLPPRVWRSVLLVSMLDKCGCFLPLSAGGEGYVFSAFQGFFSYPLCCCQQTIPLSPFCV